MDLETLSDEQLIERARRLPESEARACLQALYHRHYPRVAGWCLRLSGSRETAADLAQEVFLRAHDRLPAFRLESRFLTWLYQVARSVIINRGRAEARRRMASLDGPPGEALAEPADPAPGAEEVAARREMAAALRRAMAEDLEPLEGRVLYLHYVEGLTLPAITELLGLSNKSGAKAHIVSGVRKLKRRFGRRFHRFEGRS